MAAAAALRATQPLARPELLLPLPPLLKAITASTACEGSRSAAEEAAAAAAGAAEVAAAEAAAGAAAGAAAVGGRHLACPVRATLAAGRGCSASACRRGAAAAAAAAAAATAAAAAAATAVPQRDAAALRPLLPALCRVPSCRGRMGAAAEREASSCTRDRARLPPCGMAVDSHAPGAATAAVDAGALTGSRHSALPAAVACAAEAAAAAAALRVAGRAAASAPAQAAGAWAAAVGGPSWGASAREGSGGGAERGRLPRARTLADDACARGRGSGRWEG
jgi:hypothetical protein